MGEPESEPQEQPQPQFDPSFFFGNQVNNKTYTSYKEYFKDLDLWLKQAYFWYGVTAAFPYYLACSQYPPLSHNGEQNSERRPPPPPPPFNFQFPLNPQVPPAHTADTNQEPTIDGVECKIPSLWKRVAAESIDFLILFLLKIGMTYIAADFFDIVDLEKFDFGTFQKDTHLEYKAFLQMTHDILILEFVHRIVVCIFEAFWLQGNINGRLGGATPGKSMMGLRVIKCESSTPLRDDIVVIRPGTNLGLSTSLMRALVKNIVMAFLIPAGFAFLYFRHNRTGYDMICDTIVVEEPLIPHRPVPRPHQD